MEIIISQIIIGSILIALGWYVFKHYKFQLTIYQITLCAIMITISTILQMFSLTIPLLGFPSLKVGFSQLPIMVLGFLLNPAYAFFVGIVKDIVGLIMAPSGFPYLGFTLNTVLIGVIPALCYAKLKEASYENLRRLVFVASSILFLLSGLLVVFPSLIGIKDLYITWEIQVALVVTLLIVAVLVNRYMKVKKDTLFMIYALSVFLTEVIVNFSSTPIYLNIMYGMPIPVSIMARFFKAGFMFPITVSIGYMILKVVFRIQKGRMNEINK